MNSNNILDSILLECLTQEFTSRIENLWDKYSKQANITKCLKAWLNEEYNRNLAIYHMSRRKKDWINYKKAMRIAKHVFLITEFKKLP